MIQDSFSRAEILKKSDRSSSFWNQVHRIQFSEVGLKKFHVSPIQKRIWEHIRENGGFKNRTFETIGDVEENLCVAVLKLLNDKEKVKSLTGFGWVLKAIPDSLIAV